MPAVVRVKRRVDEEPLSAFVLNAKRRRVDAQDANKNLCNESDSASANNKQEITTLLKFAGTIKEQSDDKAITEYARFSKVEARNMVAQKLKQPTNLTDKARQEMRKHVQEQRFRVVNCMRTTLDTDIVGGGDDAAVVGCVGGGYKNQPTKELTIVDIEKQQQNDGTVKLINGGSVTEKATTTVYNQNELQPSTSAAAIAENCQQQCSPVDSDDGYVYDLYFPENESFSYSDSIDLLEDYNLSCRAIDYHSAWLDFHCNDDYYDDDDNDDSEDSNCEDYFTNDYPDEDEVCYDDDDDDVNDDDVNDDCTGDLTTAVEKFIFDDEEHDDDGDDGEKEGGSVYRANMDKLSSDEDDYDYTCPPDASSNFCSDVDDNEDEQGAEIAMELDRHHKSSS